MSKFQLFYNYDTMFEVHWNYYINYSIIFNILFEFEEVTRYVAKFRFI